MGAGSRAKYIIKCGCILRHFTIVSTFIIINIIIIIIIIIYETESTVREGFEIFFVYTTKVLIG